MQILIFVIPSLLLLYQFIFARIGFRDTYFFNENKIEYPSLSIIVPTKGESIDTIQGLLDNLADVEWDKKKLEVIIVSDDDEDYFRKIVSTLKPPNGIEVKIYRREEKKGYKSGALHYGYLKSTGELVLTLDVDARLNKDSLKKAYLHMLKFGCDAVTMKWVGYSKNSYSFLAKGIMVSTMLADSAILIGRDRAKLKVFPVGCGTIFKRSAIESVGPWDYNMIQDDLEIGARLINKGKRICASNSVVYVEVPDNLFAFYVQQTRWAMGSIEVLTRRFKNIIKSKTNLFQKIDMIMFLLQYIPVAITFIASVILAIYIFISNSNPLNSIYLFAIWITVLAMYAFNFLSVAKNAGLKFIESIRALGKVSAYTVAISPFITVALFLALKKNRKYVITPKGKAGKSNIIYLILAFGLFFLFSSIMYLIKLDIITGIWLFYYSLGFLFTFSSYKNEVE
ncbi:glycosyltransferase [Acidianus sulfidivorans]|nr:glycosyltransferase family 2 protein [Acidianus sulfidivorans]